MDSTDNCAENKHIGYKKCQDGRIVVLEILGKNNENRKDIADVRFAKMRCSKARVIQIYDMRIRSIKYDKAFGIYDKTFRYEINKVVEPVNGFDEDLNKVCGSGIHYFLTEEPARYWKYEPKNGLHKSWHENGQMWKRHIFKNGEEDGLRESWHTNGQMSVRCTLKNGKRYGLFESWYPNGQMHIRCTCKNGKEDGSYKSWHSNGQVSIRCTFNNGKVETIYSE